VLVLVLIGLCDYASLGFLDSQFDAALHRFRNMAFAEIYESFEGSKYAVRGLLIVMDGGGRMRVWVSTCMRFCIVARMTLTLARYAHGEQYYTK
jgi:hypothetical protein